MGRRAKSLRLRYVSGLRAIPQTIGAKIFLGVHMAQLTFEGFVEHGQIRLKEDVHLPEKTRVYVVVPENGDRAVNFPSPRLVHPEQSSHFVLEMVEELLWEESRR